jgi:GTPase SAR1 family protein
MLKNAPNHIDILLFGPAGSGKSSLIKTFYRSLHNSHSLPKEIDDLLKIKATNENEGTTQFTRIPIKKGSSEQSESQR